MNEINELRDEYSKAKAALVLAQQAELEARHALVRVCYPEGTNWEGTETTVCTDGHKIKITVPYTYKVIVGEEELENTLDELPDHVADRVIEFKPSVKVGEYRKLSAAHKKIVDSVLEIKPGSVQVKVE